MYLCVSVYICTYIYIQHVALVIVILVYGTVLPLGVVFSGWMRGRLCNNAGRPGVMAFAFQGLRFSVQGDNKIGGNSPVKGS